jgi:hypothetical protein
MLHEQGFSQAAATVNTRLPTAPLLGVAYERLENTWKGAIMGNNEADIREEIEELRDAIRDLRRLVIAGGNAAPAPAAVGDTAQALAIADLNEAVAELNRQVGKLPSRICEELSETFVVEPEEEETDEGKGKKKASQKQASQKPSASDKSEAEEEDEPPRRRGYFG